jgi:hypothetical protein
VLEPVESRESERDMATEVMAGVMVDVGDEKNILYVGMRCAEKTRRRDPALL